MKGSSFANVEVLPTSGNAQLLGTPLRISLNLLLAERAESMSLCVTRYVLQALF